MYEKLLKIRNRISSFKYKILFKPIFFHVDPEKVHESITKAGRVLGSNIITRKLTRLCFFYGNKKLTQNILGIEFPNPVGLGGGFDKNAQLTNILPEVGFGFIEVGSITGEPCKGNPKPRLWRLKNSNSLLVYYGLKNDGCEIISKRLANKKISIPLGINIAKTNCKETATPEVGINDYVKAYSKLKELGSYITINISCPNAYGGQPFTDPKLLEKLLLKISKIRNNKPIFLKLSPDLSKKQIDEIISVASKHKIEGFICTNLTKIRPEKLKDKIPEVGGLSGKLVEEKSNGLIKYIYSKTKGKFIIIGLGGVFSAEDAYKKIKLGASLVQVVTGMIFKGPTVISNINLGLVKLLEKEGFQNISQAIGKDVKN